MSAAARRDESRSALSDVRRHLANLEEQCISLKNLERNIIRFTADANATYTSIERFVATLADTNEKRATRSQLRKLVNAVDGFQEYVATRRERSDAEHIRGRSRVGEDVQEIIEATVEYFDTLR